MNKTSLVSVNLEKTLKTDISGAQCLECYESLQLYFCMQNIIQEN